LVVYIIYINDTPSKKISDNEIYLLIKYIKSVLWRAAKRLSYIEDVRCLKVKEMVVCGQNSETLNIKPHGTEYRIKTKKETF